MKMNRTAKKILDYLTQLYKTTRTDDAYGLYSRLRDYIIDTYSKKEDK